MELTTIIRWRCGHVASWPGRIDGAWSRRCPRCDLHAELVIEPDADLTWKRPVPAVSQATASEPPRPVTGANAA